MADTPARLPMPSDGRFEQYPSMRNYFAVGGGRTPVVGYGGDVFQDGLFVVNKWRGFENIVDGSSNTLAIGEGVHAMYGALGPDGYILT